MVKVNWNYHCHTNYTDGINTVEEIAGYCDSHGIEEIAITEHVTTKPDYDFDRLLSDIKQANEQFNVRIISGVEAKILPDGSLDCPEDIKKKVDIIIGSVHSLNNMTEQEAYEKLAETDCMIIGHPQFINDKMLSSIVRTAKVVELSGRYEQSEDMIMAYKDAGLLFSIGLDSHRLEDLDNLSEMEALIDKYGLQDRLWRY